MKPSKFTKAELESYLCNLADQLVTLKEDMDIEKASWEAVIAEKDIELDEMQCGFRAAFEEGFEIAWRELGEPMGVNAGAMDRAWLTSRTRREHGEG